MSAPNEGRQSPPPQEQSNAQTGKTADGKLDKSEDKNEGKDDQLKGLESNPKHILEDEADKKTSKTMN